MRNRWEEIVKDTRRLILDIVIAVLAFGAVIALLFAISSYREVYADSYSVDSYYYYMEEGNYPRLVELYYGERDRQEPKDGEKKEFYAVARYYEAASYYKMYQENGDTERAKEQAEKMEAARQEMGTLSGEAENICRQLEIQAP